MATSRIQLHVLLADADADADADAVAEQAAVLRQDLADLDVDDVAPLRAGDAPPGAKGIELLALGALVVKLARSRKLLGEVVDAVRDWATRNAGQTVRLEIDGDVLEITGASAAERKTLIDTWVERHGQP